MWSHIVIEGICLSRIKPPPCGKGAPSVFCLENGHCPYLLYAKSSELEASLFAPLHLIIRNKVNVIFENLYGKCRWYLWDKWRYDPNWLEKYPKGECPAWDDHIKQAEEKFSAWFAVASQSKRS